jgi:hypothetical protein
MDYCVLRILIVRLTQLSCSRLKIEAHHLDGTLLHAQFNLKQSETWATRANPKSCLSPFTQNFAFIDSNIIDRCVKYSATLVCLPIVHHS